MKVLTKTRNLLLSLVLIASFSFSCATGLGPASTETIYVNPDLSCRPLEEIIAEYPECNLLIDRALQERSEDAILEGFYCYDTVVQLLEDSYKICNTPLK